MPSSRFVTYDTANNNQIVSLPLTQAEADTDAAASTDYTAHQGTVANVPDQARPNTSWRFNVTDVAVRFIEAEMTTTELVAQRRSGLLSTLRQFEKIGGLAAWTAGELNGAGIEDLGVRGKSYSRWVEMMVRATAVDANLSTQATYDVLLREAGHPGRVWYWLHWVAGDQANGALGHVWSQQSTFSASRLGWQWYSTTGPDAFDSTVRIAAADALNPNTRGAVNGAQVIDGGQNPTLDPNINWIHYLA